MNCSGPEARRHRVGQSAGGSFENQNDDERGRQLNCIACWPPLHTGRARAICRIVTLSRVLLFSLTFLSSSGADTSSQTREMNITHGYKGISWIERHRATEHAEDFVPTGFCQRQNL